MYISCCGADLNDYTSSMSLGIELAERGIVPTPLVRLGIRRLLRNRIRDEEKRHADREAALARFIASMEGSDVAPVPARPTSSTTRCPPRSSGPASGRG